MMGRLTYKLPTGTVCSTYEEDFTLDMDYETYKEYRKVLNKLAHYEDMEEANRLVELPCKVGDTVWELCKCDDDKYRIFPMTVCRIVTFGSPRVLKDNEIEVWNIYAESDYCKMYKSFYDIGRTVFLTREEAEVVLKECESE